MGLLGLQVKAPVRWATLAAFGAACAGAGYVLGLQLPKDPPPAEVKIVVRERVVTQEVIRRVVERETHTTPEGEITVREVTHEGIDTSTDSKRASETESRPVERPWRIGLQVGAAFGREPALQLSGPLVLGATVERKIVGPFSLGAWGSTAGAAGLQVSGEF